MADVSVKMLVAMASEKNDRDVDAIVSVPADEAERLIERGFAERADGSSPAKRGRKPSATAEKAEE